MKLKRVLLVEDDRDIQVVAQMGLKMGGVEEVILAKNGQECLDMVHETAPDLILLDVMMPALDGFATCRLLKQDPKVSAIPVIFLTAMAQQSDNRKGLAAGAVGYLTKPFDPTTLFHQIMTVLGPDGHQ